MDLLRPARSCRADSLGTQPSLVIASVTRTRVRSLTISGCVHDVGNRAQRTPASVATSFMLTDALRVAIRLAPPTVLPVEPL